MATSSNKSSRSSRSSLRPHTAPNVRENLRKERERLLARQAELEELAAPINEVAGRLAKLDAVVESRSSAAVRKVEQLEKARDKKIEKIREEFDAKIAAAKQEAESADHGLTADEQAQEDALLKEYAQAIITFSATASTAELGSVLGVSTREAKKTVDQAKQDLAAVDAPATSESTSTESTVTASTPAVEPAAS